MKSVAYYVSLALGLVACSDSKPVVLADTRVTVDQGADRRADLRSIVDVRRVDQSVDRRPVDWRKDLPGQDLTVHYTATVTDKWYQGGTTCGTPELDAMYAAGSISVKLLQIPAAQVQGTCAGHKAEVTVSPGLIEIGITGNTGSACWTACWDMSFVVWGLPPGTYQVKYLNLSTSVQVYFYNG